MQDESVQGRGGVERQKVVAFRMAFTQGEMRRLYAKATERGIEIDEYANDVIREMLDRTSARRVQGDQ
jgi:hypothetical protein